MQKSFKFGLGSEPWEARRICHFVDVAIGIGLADAIGTVAATAVVGAVAGAGISAITGGNILTGAVLGGIGGGIAGGFSGAGASSLAGSVGEATATGAEVVPTTVVSAGGEDLAIPTSWIQDGTAILDSQGNFVGLAADSTAGQAVSAGMQFDPATGQFWTSNGWQTPAQIDATGSPIDQLVADTPAPAAGGVTGATSVTNGVPNVPTQLGGQTSDSIGGLTPQQTGVLAGTAQGTNASGQPVFYDAFGNQFPTSAAANASDTSILSGAAANPQQVGGQYFDAFGKQFSTQAEASASDIQALSGLQQGANGATSTSNPASLLSKLAGNFASGTGNGLSSAALLGLGAANVGTGLLGALTAQNAGGQQQQAAQSAADAQLNEFAQIRGDLAPYRALGNAAVPNLAVLTGTNPGGNPLTAALTKPFNPTQAQLEQTPGYQFTLDQGLKATENSFAAQGLGNSGAMAKGIQNYAQGLASTTYQQQFQNNLSQNQQIYAMLAGLVQSGQNAATQTGNFGTTATTNAGNFNTSGAAAGAAGNIGAANAISNGVSNISNLFTTDQILAALGGGQSGLSSLFS